MTLPRQFAQIPRFRLLYPDPSPIHPLQALTTILSEPSPNPKTRITLHAKREDHSSPLACAGNKYRKLEYLIPDILDPNPPTPKSAINGGATVTGKVTTIVTEGAVQSNHTIQVASVAQRLGLECVVILHKGTGGGLAAAADKDAFLRVGNVQIAKLLGAEVRLLEPSSQQGQEQKTDPVLEILNELAARGKVPYWIPSGASLHPVGGLGYARAAFEIAAQEQQASQNKELGGSGRYDYIFVACGSGSTVGGLIAGFKLLEKHAHSHAHPDPYPPRKVIGILNSPTMPRAYHEQRVLRFARMAGGMIGLDCEKDITMDDVCLDDRFAGTAYGVLDPEAKQYLNMMAQKEGVILDPVYTAKVARGLVHWVEQGDLERDWARRVAAGSGPHSSEINALIIHTGGQSALPAYANVD